MTAVRFDNIWLSTPVHLEAWDRMYYDKKGKPIVYKKATIPDGFPHVRPFWGFSSMAIPVVYLASGTLTLDTSHIQFQPREHRFMGNKHIGLLADAAFQLSLPDIRSRQFYLLKSPVSEMFDMTFARLSTSRPGMLSDFALAVGITGLNFRKAKQRNQEFLSILVPSGSA